MIIVLDINNSILILIIQSSWIKILELRIMDRKIKISDIRNQQSILEIRINKS